VARGEHDPPSQRDRPHVGSAAARAYAHLKERLLDGRLPGGTLLSENETAHELGVSRTPVRQAFVQLEAEGLLDLYPRRGGSDVRSVTLGRGVVFPAGHPGVP
jgi:DNA-binding GntR family transcriptional regulator